MSFGAEAMSDEIEEKAQDHKWVLAKEFKLLLHPDELKTDMNIGEPCQSNSDLA
jgi:hypothetical protein